MTSTKFCKATSKRLDRLVPRAGQEAIETLRRTLSPGMRVGTILRSVSRSGMTRHISVVLHDKDGINDISYLVARATENRLADDYGVVVRGCGMDMGFELVYNLSRALFPDGFGVPCEKCGVRANSKEDAASRRSQSSAAAEAMHDNDSHCCKYHGRNGDPSGWDNSGGYALKQYWI